MAAILGDGSPCDSNMAVGQSVSDTVYSHNKVEKTGGIGLKRCPSVRGEDRSRQEVTQLTGLQQRHELARVCGSPCCLHVSPEPQEESDWSIRGQLQVLLVYLLS